MINLIQFCKFQTLGGLLFNTWRISCKFHEQNWSLRVDGFFLESRAARVILSDPTGQYWRGFFCL